jgi:hypothetical protein
MRRFLFMMLCFLPLLLVACGADDSSSYTPIQDTAETSARIQFVPGTSEIAVLEKGPDANGQVIDLCTFSLDTIDNRLAYRLVDDQTLELGSSRFTYSKPLATPVSVSGVPSRLFAVWEGAPTVRQGVTLALELEISAERLLFRMNCAQ